MRNAVSFFKQNRRLALILACWGSCAALGAGAGSPAAAQVAAPALPQQELRLPGRPAPDIAAVFLPRHLPPGSYVVTVLDAPLPEARATMIAALAPDARADDPAGPWSVQRADPLAAFGDAARFDRPTLARLYAGRPVSVVRAPLTRGGRVVGALTLLSPYPDARLTRLSAGTLAILLVTDVARGAARDGRTRPEPR